MNIGYDEDDLKIERVENFPRYSARNERAYRAGKRLAVADMLNECFEIGEPPPRWVVQAVDKLIRKKPPSLGNLKHSMRWAEVNALRRQVQSGAERMTWPQTYQAASDALRRTIAKGNSDAVEKSYKLVAKAMREGWADRYALSYLD